jgi:hypothetical protein
MFRQGTTPFLLVLPAETTARTIHAPQRKTDLLWHMSVPQNFNSTILPTKLRYASSTDNHHRRSSRVSLAGKETKEGFLRVEILFRAQRR